VSRAGLEPAATAVFHAAIQQPEADGRLYLLRDNAFHRIRLNSRRRRREQRRIIKQARAGGVPESDIHLNWYTGVFKLRKEISGFPPTSSARSFRPNPAVAIPQPHPGPVPLRTTGTTHRRLTCQYGLAGRLRVPNITDCCSSGLLQRRRIHKRSASRACPCIAPSLIVRGFHEPLHLSNMGMTFQHFQTCLRMALRPSVHQTSPPESVSSAGK
jgi:hypothetical protein